VFVFYAFGVGLQQKKALRQQTGNKKARRKQAMSTYIHAYMHACGVECLNIKPPAVPVEENRSKKC
jgi:hypothetical protein